MAEKLEMAEWRPFFLNLYHCIANIVNYMINTKKIDLCCTRITHDKKIFKIADRKKKAPA